MASLKLDVDPPSLKDLEIDNHYFDSIVDMFPARIYLAGQDEEAKIPRKYQRKADKKHGRATVKRAKYDPSLQETTCQTKERLSVEEDSKLQRELQESGATAGSHEKQSFDGKSRIEALRAKLKAKMEELRSNLPEASAISKRAARRAAKEERRKQAKKRGAASRMKTAEKKQSISIAHQDTQEILNDLQQLDFGKLSGLRSPSTHQNNKSLEGSKGKNLKRMLEQAQQKKLKLQELKEQHKDDALKKELWKDTLQEASGTRVKDDPSKLKKHLKRKEAKKAKSQKAWKSRMNATKQQMQERQVSRNKNLQERKNRAGFEGKRRAFINSEKKTTSNQ